MRHVTCGIVSISAVSNAVRGGINRKIGLADWKRRVTTDHRLSQAICQTITSPLQAPGLGA
jgi:hypothetical protein